MDLGVRQRGRGAARALRARQARPVERRGRTSTGPFRCRGRVVHAADRRLAAVEPPHRDGRRREDLPRGGVGRVLAPHLAAAARRAGRAAALRPARQLLPDHGPEVVRRLAGDRRGAPRRGVLEVPAPQDGRGRPDRSHAEGAARQAARRADLADEVPRHADALRGHGGRHHGPRPAREHESADQGHHPPRASGRGAPRGLRHPHHAPAGEGVATPRRWTSSRTSRSTSSRR